jgi:hypothetical protein
MILTSYFIGDAAAQSVKKFRSDDPLKIDEDRHPVAVPEGRPLSQIFDFLENTFVVRPKAGEPIPQAENVNTLGEVPDSSWFTNRLGRVEMTDEEVVRGPNKAVGPLMPWLIVGAKTEGVTPGFTVKDQRGDIYYVKFDPRRYPQLSTSAEMISTKFFYAFGYNVPENYLRFIRRQDVLLSPHEGLCSAECLLKEHLHKVAVFVDEEGKERPLTEKDIDNLFESLARLPDGTVPAVASFRLEGKPLGPFKYLGTREDDSNDIFPHENRRELRGLRVFSAWLNHDDSRSINSLDMYIGEPGRGYVRHHLIDFGSTLGSGSVKPQGKRAGNEYMFEGTPILKAGLSLGIWDRHWRHIPYPDYPSVGRFEADHFQAHLWKPEYPNPAFERMQPQDASWAARILARVTDKMIRAVVLSGQIANPEASEYLIQTLIKRRDNTLHHYLGVLNPIDQFKLERNPSKLSFSNLGEKVGLGADSTYEYRWFRFDNVEGTREPISEKQVTEKNQILLPGQEAPFLMVRLRTLNQAHESWASAIDVYVRSSDFKIVGIDR